MSCDMIESIVDYIHMMIIIYFDIVMSVCGRTIIKNPNLVCNKIIYFVIY